MCSVIILKSGISVIIVFWFTLSTLCYADEINIETFIDNAFLTYKTSFTVNTSLELWNRILDNPHLMGKLWDIYNFSPPYKVSIKDSSYHIIDPTGIEGDFYEIESGKNKRVFLAEGRMKKWFIPVSLRGKALFVLHYTYSQSLVSVKLHIYGEGSKSLLENLALKALSPILHISINRRVKHNVSDLKILISDITNDPDKIRPFLGSELLENFNCLYN